MLLPGGGFSRSLEFSSLLLPGGGLARLIDFSFCVCGVAVVSHDSTAYVPCRACGHLRRACYFFYRAVPVCFSQMFFGCVMCEACAKCAEKGAKKKGRTVTFVLGTLVSVRRVAPRLVVAT